MSCLKCLFILFVSFPLSLFADSGAPRYRQNVVLDDTSQVVVKEYFKYLKTNQAYKKLPRYLVNEHRSNIASGWKPTIAFFRVINPESPKRVMFSYYFVKGSRNRGYPPENCFIMEQNGPKWVFSEFMDHCFE